MDREGLHNDDNFPWSPVDILIDWIDEHADPELVAKDDGYWLEGKGGGGTPWCLGQVLGSGVSVFSNHDCHSLVSILIRTGYQIPVKQ